MLEFCTPTGGGPRLSRLLGGSWCTILDGNAHHCGGHGLDYKLYSDQLWCLVKCVEDGGILNSHKFMDHWGNSFADKEAPINLQLIQASLPLTSPTSFYTSHITKSSAQSAIDCLSDVSRQTRQGRLTPNGRSSRHWKRSAWFAKISQGLRWGI